MFQNREQAGKLLAEKLVTFKNNKEAIVLAIPRGGVIVARIIADKLSLPLTLAVVKKLGAPGNPELAIGALAPSGVKYIDWDLALRSGAEQDYLDREIAKKKREIEERIKKFKVQSSKSKVENKEIRILVDDGVATGATTLAAIKYIKSLKPTTHNTSTSLSASPQPTTILAVPVIAKETYNRLQKEVDKIVALEAPEFFGAVGEFYREFPQISDEEVISLLEDGY